MVKNKYLLEVMTPELAYWIGYIAADGHLTKDDLKVTFCIKNTDKVLLEEFVKYFNITNKIATRHVYDKRTNKTYGQVNLQVCGVEFVRGLKKYNLSNNKSKVFQIPDVILQNEYIFEFLKGLLDGDGYIYNRPHRKTTEIGFLSTMECVEQIKKFLEINFNIKSTTREYLYSKGTAPINMYNLYRLYICKDALLLLDKIYKKGFVLKRKYDSYQIAKSIKDSKLNDKTRIF